MKIRSHRIVLLLLVAFTLQANAKEYGVLDIVGDSISAGVNPECGIFGWVHMLSGEGDGSTPAKTNTVFTLWPGITNWNSAVSGSKASDWAADWGNRLSDVKAHHPDLVVVFIGGNDLSFYMVDGHFSVSEQEEYRTNLSSILTNLVDNTPVPDILLVNYYDLFDGYSANLGFPLGNYTNMSQASILCNQVIKEAAVSNRCYLVEGVYDGFMHHGYGGELGDAGHLLPDYVRTPLIQFDIHPITAGHSKIYDLVYEKLEYLKTYAVPEYWLAQYGLTNYAEDVAIDQDLDGAKAWEEYVAGTCPTSTASVFDISKSSTVSSNGYILRWNAVSNRSYSLFLSTNLVDGFQLLQASLPGNVYTDTVYKIEEQTFYQIRVQQE